MLTQSLARVSNLLHEHYPIAFTQQRVLFPDDIDLIEKRVGENPGLTVFVIHQPMLIEDGLYRQYSCMIDFASDNSIKAREDAEGFIENVSVRSARLPRDMRQPFLAYVRDKGFHRYNLQFALYMK